MIRGLWTWCAGIAYGYSTEYISARCGPSVKIVARSMRSFLILSLFFRVETLPGHILTTGDVTATRDPGCHAASSAMPLRAVNAGKMALTLIERLRSTCVLYRQADLARLFPQPDQASRHIQYW
jgi:hypothetical protein